MEEPRDIMMGMDRKEVDEVEPDLRGNVTRKNRRKGGLAKDAPGLLAS